MQDKEIEKLLNDIKQIENVAEILEEINFGKIELLTGEICNFISEFSRRNKSLIHSIINMIIRNNKSSLTNDEIIDIEGDKILIIFALRDIIENIEILSWLKLNNDSWVKEDEEGNIKIEDSEDFLNIIEEYLESINREKYIGYINKISGKENMKSYKIKKDSKNSLELELEKKFGPINLSKDFDNIENLKKMLHNYIHKNGIKYINLERIKYREFTKDYLEKLKFIFKFYFKISFLLDNTCIASSDYIDCLECGIEPPEDCQYWVAPIFTQYIDSQFNEEDKKWIKENNRLNMQFKIN